MTTKNLLNWKPEAEGERQQMSQLYTDLLGIKDAVANNEFIIMGRKGAGKSAYAVYLQALADDPNNMFSCQTISSTDIHIERLINEVDDGTSKYTVLLEWLILINLVRLILNNPEGRYSKNYQDLAQFYKTTSGHVEFTKNTISETIWSQEFNITPLENINIKAGRQVTEKNYKASFFSMITSLRAAVSATLKQDVFKKYKFYILIDDLDVDFSLKDEQAKKRLLALLRVVCRYNTDFLGQTSAKILVFVRNDIANKLSSVGGDSQKMIDSYGFTINWYRGVEEGEDYLYKMINHRLEIALKEHQIPYSEKTPWDVFAKDSYIQFKRLLDYTFYLPRDIIGILNRSKDKNWSLPLSADKFDILVAEYSNSKYEEVCNELTASLDSEEIKDVKKVLYNVAKDVKNYGALSYEQIMAHLEKVSLSESHFQILLEHDIFVPVEKSNINIFLYSYREKKRLGSDEDYLYRLPKVLYGLFYNNH